MFEKLFLESFELFTYYKFSKSKEWNFYEILGEYVFFC